MTKKADWTKIKNEYITTNTSYAKLAKKYNVSQSAVEKRAIKEKWSDSRKSMKVKIQAKTEEKFIQLEVDRNIRHIGLIDKVLDAVERIINKELNKKVINHAKLEKVMNVIDKAQKGHRLAEGLDKDKSKDGIETNGFEDEFSELIDK